MTLASLMDVSSLSPEPTQDHAPVIGAHAGGAKGDGTIATGKPKVRILLSEGSSTNAREVISALGPKGYVLDVCDPNPICLGRFSRYVRKVHRSPVSGSDPMGYLRFVDELLREHHYDVLLPVNEQAYLFSWARHHLSALTGLAVADFAAFTRVQTKANFHDLLDELGLPQPVTLIARTWSQIEAGVASITFPCYLKTSYGTASTGVWRIGDADDLNEAKVSLQRQGLPDAETEILVQKAAEGVFEQSHAVFDRGRLIALHCTRRLREGAGGGAAVKVGVDRPIVAGHFERLGKELEWHGGMSIDYFWNEETLSPSYIDANPRITEPMNAVVNGVNVADLQVRLSLGERTPTPASAHVGRRSHNTLQALLGAAVRDHSRGAVIREATHVALRRGPYSNSHEWMTPIWRDPPSALPLAVVLISLLLNPHNGARLASMTIGNYSLGAVIDAIPGLDPNEIFREPADDSS
jgi:predicted ATP-grasp superfamily ATP-dependent carboligase